MTEKVALLPSLRVGELDAGLVVGRSGSCSASQAVASPGSVGSQSSRPLTILGLPKWRLPPPGGCLVLAITQSLFPSFPLLAPPTSLGILLFLGWSPASEGLHVSVTKCH